MQALSFLIGTLLELYTFTFLLRFFMQRARIDFRNPLAQFIIQVTNPLVRPLRRVVPGWKGLDLSSLVVAFALTLVTVVILRAIAGLPIPGAGVLLIAGLLQFGLMIIRMFIFVILVYVLMSWFAPFHPVREVLENIAEPLLMPVRRIMPSIGGLDLSPLVVLLGLQALIILINTSFAG